MSPKTQERVGTHGRKRWGDLLTPGRVVVGLLAILALVFVFQNTQSTDIQLLVSEVTMPLWLALLGTGLVGAVCGAYVMRRRR
ncbi:MULTISPECIES: lipopolysaccharide assembly protein LapA domain-containing protein [Streptomyces]|uniref:LapA family protein n=1 Tax=Streptomyces griseiscabiei TaxID=2993540 RepID=A0ABU4LKH8_9ACTN|nr:MULTISPECIES: LapA family protein [Streptomyces]MBZ3904953.1 LapA family protein [Streptomyces griseiscabiei]MDX2915458.1 LapA family protein [Streptomyces griseiscabiei]